MLIGLIGQKLAGKDTAANYLVSKYGAVHFKISSLLDELLTILNLPLTRDNEILLGNNLREVFGNKVVIDAVVHRMQKDKSPFIIFNGIRLLEEFNAIRQLGGKLVFITADPLARFERYKLRGARPDDGTLSYQDFLKQDSLEITEREILDLGQRADAEVTNNFSLEDFYSKLDKTVKSLEL